MANLASPAIASSVLTATSARESSRIQSVDALRGAIIIIMAIDHIRDFISAAAMSFSPTDLSRTTAALFLTRWITHFCAPVFALTAGIGACLWLGRGRRTSQLSRFLLSRGLWLVFLELTVLRFIVFSNMGFSNTVVILSVIWMLGLSMIALSGLVYLPTRLLAVLSLAVIAGHNLFDGVNARQFGSGAWIWEILHQQGIFRIHNATFLVAYPLIPWVAVMSAGYCLGGVYRWEPVRRRRFLLRLGWGLSLTFVVLRAANVYGDPVRWSAQNTKLFTVLSFLNCNILHRFSSYS